MGEATADPGRVHFRADESVEEFPTHPPRYRFHASHEGSKLMARRLPPKARRHAVEWNLHVLCVCPPPWRPDAAKDDAAREMVEAWPDKSVGPNPNWGVARFHPDPVVRLAEACRQIEFQGRLAAFWTVHAMQRPPFKPGDDTRAVDYLAELEAEG